MSEDHTSSLRFSLEESVWFQRGQEVEELYSISLEPNVSAHHVEQYVILKGTLDLMGEYKAIEATGQEEGAEDPFRRYVSVIEQREHHLFEFHQQFPVDITIPAERVREMDELNIGVHTFDYKLPEKGYLQIRADLWIGGVYDNLPEEQTQVTETEEREETSNYQNGTSEQFQEEHHTHTWDKINEDFEESAEEITIQAEVHNEQEEEQIEVHLYRENSEDEDQDQEQEDLADSPEIYLKNPTSYIESNHNQDDHFYVETKLSPRMHQPADYEETQPNDKSDHTDKDYSPFAFEPDQLVDRQKQKDENQSFSIPYDNRFDEGPPELMEVVPFTVEYEKEESSEYEKEESPEYDRVQPHQSQANVAPDLNKAAVEPEKNVSRIRQQKKEQTSNQYVEKKYQSSDSKRENGNEGQTEGKSKSLLYDLFTEEEESQQSKVRVCIVQNGENIDVLADRYKTSVQHIARINGLELTSDLKAGQVIYIPEAAASYK